MTEGMPPLRNCGGELSGAVVVVVVASVVLLVEVAVEELEAEVGVEKNAYMTPTAMADDAKADDAKRRFRFSGSLTY
jgi:hypothetical protein